MGVGLLYSVRGGGLVTGVCWVPSGGGGLDGLYSDNREQMEAGKPTVAYAHPDSAWSRGGQCAAYGCINMGRLGDPHGPQVRG
jgi:hypothetical protein